MLLPESNTWCPQLSLCLIQSLFIRRNQTQIFVCHSRKTTSICSTPCTLLAEEPAEPVWACQQQQVYWRQTFSCAMALLTLHRIPSLAAAPVSPLIPTPHRIRKPVRHFASYPQTNHCLHFASLRVIHNCANCLCRDLVVERLFLNLSVCGLWSVHLPTW